MKADGAKRKKKFQHEQKYMCRNYDLSIFLSNFFAFTFVVNRIFKFIDPKMMGHDIDINANTWKPQQSHANSELCSCFSTYHFEISTFSPSWYLDQRVIYRWEFANGIEILFSQNVLHSLLRFKFISGIDQKKTPFEKEKNKTRASWKK